MATISYARHQFPPDVIRRAVWLYMRLTLSYRDVEDMLSSAIRFRRAKGRCEACGRPHGKLVVHLGDGRWWDDERRAWRSGQGKALRRPCEVDHAHEYKITRQAKIQEDNLKTYLWEDRHIGQISATRVAQGVGLGVVFSNSKTRFTPRYVRLRGCSRIRIVGRDSKAG